MNRILNHLTTDWYKYLLELIVITAGVLGAFALNNWNEGRLQNKRSIELLGALMAEHENNQHQLDEVLEVHRMVRKSAIDLLHIINQNSPVDEDSLKKHLANVAWAVTFDPQKSVINSAISSGDIHYLKNEGLKQAILKWPDMAFDVQEEEQRSKELYTNFLLPYTLKFIMETDLIRENYNNPELDFESRHNSDYKGLVFNRNFENLIALRLENIVDILLELEPIEAENTRIISMINSELERIN